MIFFGIAQQFRQFKILWGRWRSSRFNHRRSRQDQQFQIFAASPTITSKTCCIHCWNYCVSWKWSDAVPSWRERPNQMHLLKSLDNFRQLMFLFSCVFILPNNLICSYLAILRARPWRIPKFCRSWFHLQIAWLQGIVQERDLSYRSGCPRNWFVMVQHLQTCRSTHDQEHA